MKQKTIHVTDLSLCVVSDIVIKNVLRAPAISKLYGINILSVIHNFHDQLMNIYFEEKTPKYLLGTDI